MSTTSNEPYYGTMGHTQQLMRVKSAEPDVIEFSIFRVRQRAKASNGKPRGCSSRIWLLKRFKSGLLIRVRITASALEALAAIETEPLKFLRCGELWNAGKHRTTSHEPPER